MFPISNFYPLNNHTFSSNLLISFVVRMFCQFGIGLNARTASGSFMGCSYMMIKLKLKLIKPLGFALIIFMNCNHLFISTFFMTFIYANLSHFVMFSHSFCFVIYQLMLYRTN